MLTELDSTSYFVFVLDVLRTRTFVCTRCRTSGRTVHQVFGGGLLCRTRAPQHQDTTTPSAPPPRQIPAHPSPPDPPVQKSKTLRGATPLRALGAPRSGLRWPLGGGGGQKTEPESEGGGDLASSDEASGHRPLLSKPLSAPRQQHGLIPTKLAPIWPQRATTWQHRPESCPNRPMRWSMLGRISSHGATARPLFANFSTI